MKSTTALLFAIAACAPSAPPQDRAQPEPAAQLEPAAQPEPVVAKPEPVAQPEPVVAKPEPVAQPEPAAEPEPAAAPAPTFHTVATIAAAKDEQSPHFHVLEAADGEVIVTVGPQVIRVAPDGSFTRDPNMLRGIDALADEPEDSLFMLATWDVIAAGGRWPHGFYITMSAEFGYRGEGFPNWVYRRTDDRWVAVDTKGDAFHWFPSDLAPWKDGSVLALRGFSPIHRYPAKRDETTEPTAASVKRAQAAIERQRPLIVIRGAPKAPDLGRRDIAAIDALPTGEIVGVVVGEKPLAVHFDPISSAVTERPLPGHELQHADVLIESSARVWIHGMTSGDPVGPYLARFDGEAWHEEPTPACEDVGIGSMSRAPEGDTWIVCGHPGTYAMFDGDVASLWRRLGDRDAWEQVSLPDGAVPADVVARARDDVWVGGSVLLHTRARERVVTVPGYTGLWVERRELAK